MPPIETHDGKPKIFVVGNGGAGLLLTGSDISATEFHRGTLHLCTSEKYSFVENEERLDHFFDRSCRCARLLLALSGRSAGAA